MLIRPEMPADHTAIRRVNLAAFGSPLEAALVEQLRGDGLLIASLVAVDDASQVVGHIAFGPVTIVAAEADEMKIASLAPMSVLPSHQHRGIGSMLVEHGIEACRQAHYQAIIVVGHRRYYPRFGVSNAPVAGLRNPFASDAGAFMGLELIQGALSGMEGRVVYPEAFSQFLK